MDLQHHENNPKGHVSAFRQVPRTGVIYVMNEAAAAGYSAGDPSWANLGQGQPETGPLPKAPQRVNELMIAAEDFEYAPVAGLRSLGEAVAEHYNQTYKKGSLSMHLGECMHILRWTGGPDSHRGGAWLNQFRPLSARLYRLRGIAGRL